MQYINKIKYDNVYNYVYCITHRITKMKYIGSRKCSIDPYTDLKKYKTSSSDQCFKAELKNIPFNFEYEILSYHSSRKDAYKRECELHQLFNVKDNPMYYNRCNAIESGFDVTGYVRAKDCQGNHYYISKNDSRYKSGELVHANKGIAFYYDNGKVIALDKNDKRRNELQSVNKSKIIVTNGTDIFAINKNDSRYKKTLFPINKGKVRVRDLHNNTKQIDVSDPLYNVTYFYIPHENKSMQNRLPVYDTSLNCMKVVSLYDYYNNDNYRSVNEGKVNVTNGTDSFQVSKEEYRNGEYDSTTKGKVNVKDKFGNIFCIDINDIRYKNGEIIGVTGFWYEVNGIVYSYKQLKLLYNISASAIRKRCRSTNEKWKDWKIIN